MALDDFVVFLRLVTPVLLLWLGAIVWRAPSQEHANRALAGFLLVVGVGFLAEFFWDMTLGVAQEWSQPLRAVQEFLGFVDPPLLLLFALLLPRRRGTLLVTAAIVLLTLVGVGLWSAGSTFDLADADGLRLANILFVNGTYLVAFALVLVQYLGERREFLARQQRILAIGVGFAALSRSSAFFLAGAPSWMEGLFVNDEALLGPLVGYALLGSVALGVGLSRGARPRRDVVVPLAVILAVFFAFYALLLWVAAVTGLGQLPSLYFNSRWIVFAGVVGYGLLRYQLFDFGLRRRQAAALGGAAFGAVIAGALAGAALNDQGLSLLQARLWGLMVTALVGTVLYVVADRGLRRVFPDRAEDDVVYRRRRLEIYQATLEFALESPDWDEDARRFVDSLREVFEVTPDEHARVVRNIREASPESQS